MIGRDDLVRILGPLDEAKIIAILALSPTLATVEEAGVWAAGNGDLLARSGHPLSAVAAAIVDILTAEDEEPPPTG